MNTQLLISTMNMDDLSLLERMNVQCDALVGNQTKFNRIDEKKWKDYNIKVLNFSEKGVGLNRNNTLMRADADICIFADDDMRYCDGYKTMVENYFIKYPKADVLIFNLLEKDVKRPVIKKVHRVHFWNFLRYGTARVAVRNQSIQREGIYFNQTFGGGTGHCHGEDNLFLADCLKKRLVIYAIPEYIAQLEENRESTWDNGDTFKYLSDQGMLYHVLTKKYWRLLCLQDAIRHSRDYKMSWIKAYRIMIKGKTEGN